MSEHSARIAWRRDTQPGEPDDRYGRRHEMHFDGGATIVASASPSIVPPPWSDPAAVDPEELFVASLASCHLLWFLSIAARRNWRVERYDDDASGTLARNAEGRLAVTAVTLRPRVLFGGGREPDDAALRALHDEAHAACFIANSVRTDVRCEPRR